MDTELDPECARCGIQHEGHVLVRYPLREGAGEGWFRFRPDWVRYWPGPSCWSCYRCHVRWYDPNMARRSAQGVGDRA
jgi:hypothetical protein